MVGIEPSRRIVLIAVETLGGGGAERVVLDLVRHWPRDHAQPVLLVAARRGEYAADLPPGVPVLEVGVPSSPRRIPAFMNRLRGLLRGRQVAGVISHMTGMNRMLLRAQLIGVVRAPVIVVEHCNFLREYNLQQMPRLRRWLLLAETGFLYRRAAAVVGCSEGVARQVGALFSIASTRQRAIVNPVSPRFLAPAPLTPEIASWFDGLQRPVVVSVGRMVEQKCFADLIEAFAVQPAGTLVVLGNGPQRADLVALAQEKGVADRVVMPGFLAAPEQVLQAADLYVSSSLWEGYPLTLVEAYACGLPVVARDCDFGPAEIVLLDRPGRLVPPGDVSALAAAIGECLRLYPRFAPGTSVDLAQNDPDYVARRYCDLLEQVSGQ